MSEKGFAGGNMQIPSGVRWGGNGTVGDVGANNCKYIFQIVDQNGNPIQARQQVNVGLCTCATAIGTNDAGLGPKVPTATEIVSSLLLAQAATVLVANGEAVNTVKVGSTDEAGNLQLAGVIGVHGLLQGYIPVVGGGATYMQSIFETDAEGKFTLFVTVAPALTAIVLKLASGKNLYFKNVSAA